MPANSLSIKILDPCQYDEWDQFVSRSDQGNIFCYSWWLDAATKSNFKIYTVLENNEIVAGFPAPLDAHNKINEPPLTRTLGVLFRPQSHLQDDKRSDTERKWLIYLLENIHLKDFVQICTHHTITDCLPFKWKGLKQTTRYTYLIDYKGKTEDDLRTGLNRGKKSMINKALRHGLKVEESDDFKLLYHVTEMSFKRQGLKFRLPYDTLHLLDNAAGNKGNRLILKVFDQAGKIHAAIYLAFNNRSAYYLLSGSYPEYRDFGGHTLVLWEAIKYFRDKVDYFNFGGSEIRNIEEHVRGFGGVMTPYFHIYNDQLMHYTDIRYNIKKMLFYLNSLFRAIRMKYLAN